MSASETSIASSPLTHEQGEEILNELRLIREAFEDRRSNVADRASNPIPATQASGIMVDRSWPAIGSDQAPVTVVEFSDFQCPFCRRFNLETFPNIKKMYIDTGKVRFISLEYLLSFHPDALNAALAARCAGLQNQYWQMRSKIIDGGSDLSPEKLDQEAQELTLDMVKFRACTKDKRIAESIQHDVLEGQNVGVTGTPAFLIGRTRDNVVQGVRLDGAQPYAQFELAISEALIAAKADAHVQ